MERHEILELMRKLKLAGMRAAFDEVLATGLKRQHSLQQIIGDLLQAEIAEKQARSIRYQVTIARLPLAKELADFNFSATPVNEPLIRELASAGFLAQQRNAVLVGGTGTCSATIWVEVVLPHPRMLPRSRPIASPRCSRCITCVSFGGGRT